MFRNYLAAALRNLARNRLHAGITTISLAIGFTAAILAAVYWRYETTYDSFWPNAQRLYLVGQWDYPFRDGGPLLSDAAKASLGPEIPREIPQVEAVARMIPDTLAFEHGQVHAFENNVQWADPNLFGVLHPTVVAGDIRTALTPANAIVLTQSLARKYFGDANPVGQILTVRRDKRESDMHAPPAMALQVTAVIADIPVNSHVEASAFISANSGAAPFAGPEAAAFTYILARPGADTTAIRRGLDGMAERELPPAPGKTRHGELKLLPIHQVYLKPAGYGVFHGGTATSWSMKDGERFLIRIAVWLSALILAIAAINFITLMTARGSQRGVEVGVRRASGAQRGDLVVQFLGEALLYALLAVLVALAAAELMLPVINKLLGGTAMRLHYLRDGWLTVGVLACALLIGLLAGAYPALVLSGFRPASVLKGGPVKSPGSARLRKALIALQFTPLIFLALTAGTLIRMQQDSNANSHRMMPGNPLLVFEPCSPGFVDRLHEEPAITSVVCTPLMGSRSDLKAGALMVGLSVGDSQVFDGKGRKVDVEVTAVDQPTLDFHGLRLAAGRAWNDGEGGPSVLINEGAARKLGYAVPGAAVGRTVSWMAKGHPRQTASVIGVLGDRGGVSGFESVLFINDPALATHTPRGIGVRLRPGTSPAQALAAVDEAFAATGAAHAPKRQFFDEKLAENQGGNVIASVLGIVIVVGGITASLGLFGLAAFLVEQRTKEIGVRKALGAGRAQVLRLVLIQFAWPVILANLIAAPLILLVDVVLKTVAPPGTGVPSVGPEVFAVVVTGSILLAFAATFGHAWQVTRARPVTALRYE